MRSIPRQIEDRIERQQRIGRNIRVDAPKILYFPENTGRVVAPGESPSRFEWRCDYFSEAKYLRTGVNTAVGADSITVDNGDTGAAGTFSATDLTYTDGTQSWATDEWTGYFLKVGAVYYTILSNTATILTLQLLRGTLIENTSYSIVPFIPNSLVGLVINPDTADDEIYTIESNTETVITVTVESVRIAGTRAAVTTGDAGAPYNTFRATALVGYADDFWNGFAILFLNGDNAGESQIIADYTGTTGEFVTGNFSNSIDVSDDFKILRSILNISVGATWRLETGYIAGASDFASNITFIIKREVGTSGFIGNIYIPRYTFRPISVSPYRIKSGSGFRFGDGGGINDSNFDRPFVGRYAVEILSESTKTISVYLDFNGAINIQMVNILSNKRTTIKQASSPAQIAQPQLLLFSLEAFTWYRIEIYLYVPTTIQGKLRISDISSQINSWRDITAGAPTVVSVTGADLANSSDPGTMAEELITLVWTNNTYAIRGQTEIHVSDTEGGTYTKLISLDLNVATHSIQYQPGTTKWFKLRHVSDSGVLGPFADAQKGITMSAGAGNTVVTLEWVDNVGAAVFPNENGWFNDAVLKAKITVSTDLTISAILFTRTGAAQADLGASSPATSAAITETAAGVASVIVQFTNGMATISQSWSYLYDKTAPTAPVFEVPANTDNFEIRIFLDTDTTDALSGKWGVEWYWSTSSTDPISSTTAMDFKFGRNLHLGMAEYDFVETTLYIWVRGVDRAGNKSAWVQYNGPSGSLDLTTREITSKYEVRDLIEFSGG